MLVKGGFTQISGSVGGWTGSHNRGGLYIRARTIPVNPNTALQQAVRNIVSQLSNLWVDTLTIAQRDAWKLYADNVQVQGPLGDAITLTGLNMYVRSNTARLQAALPRVDAAPTIFDVGDFTNPSFALDEPADEVDVTFINTDAWANEDDSSMLVYSSRPVSPSINFFKGPYRFAGKIDGDAITPPTSPAAIALPQGVSAGQRVFLRVAVSRADGRYSNPFRGSGDA